jgi:hypothetical protein
LYRISQLADLAPGTEIRNTAYIYFDFNPAIITNTALNTIQDNTSVKKELVNLSSVFPNPASEKLQVVLHGANSARMQLFDMTGKLVVQKALTPGLNTVNIAGLSSGVYTLMVHSENGMKTEKISIVR